MGAVSHLLYFMCCDFPDFGHKAKYAPFGMLGKPKSAVIIKGAHYPRVCDICDIIFCIISIGLLPCPIPAIIFLAIAMPMDMGFVAASPPIWVCDVSLMRTSLKQQIRPSCGVI